MTDEIKRSAEGAVDELLSRYEEGFDSKASLRVLMSKYLLAERRKAYEECARIAEEFIPTKPVFHEGKQIANEIRSRMEAL